MKCGYRFLIAFPLVFCLTIQAQLADDDPVSVKSLKAAYQEKLSMFKLECTLHIPHPYHINSDSVPQPYLIPTKIYLADSNQGTFAKRDYPQALQKKLFGHKLEVFEGDITFREYFHLNKGVGFPLGAVLQYQSCDDKMCYPPKRREVVVTRKGKILKAVLAEE